MCFLCPNFVCVSARRTFSLLFALVFMVSVCCLNSQDCWVRVDCDGGVVECDVRLGSYFLVEWGDICVVYFDVFSFFLVDSQTTSS